MHNSYGIFVYMRFDYWNIQIEYGKTGRILMWNISRIHRAKRVSILQNTFVYSGRIGPYSDAFWHEFLPFRAVLQDLEPPDFEISIGIPFYRPLCNGPRNLVHICTPNVKRNKKSANRRLYGTPCWWISQLRNMWMIKARHRQCNKMLRIFSHNTILEEYLRTGEVFSTAYQES